MSSILEILDSAIARQEAMMRGYEIASAALTLETLRSLDFAFFDQAIAGLGGTEDARYTRIMRMGINESLDRVLPSFLPETGGQPHWSTPELQAKADGFVFDCGVLALAKLQRTLLVEGLLTGYVDRRAAAGDRILVLDATDPTTYAEAIGGSGIVWLAKDRVGGDCFREEELEAHCAKVIPGIAAGSGPNPHLLYEVEEQLHELAQIHLRKMINRDLLDESDSFGGRTYGYFVEALTSLAILCHMRMFVAVTHGMSDTSGSARNYLTGFISVEDLNLSVAQFLDATVAEAAIALNYLSLSPANKEAHLRRGAMALAPVVRTSGEYCVLPCFGADVNPFAYLHHSLREMHSYDWFRVANLREARWLKELKRMFPSQSWKSASGVKLKRGRNTVTDLDFVLYDASDRVMALFQLKWQQPNLGDERVRRSNARNLVEASNKWVEEVLGWLAEFGVAELATRTRLNAVNVEKVILFVVGRYSAHMPIPIASDSRATWIDWGNFCRCWSERSDDSLVGLARSIEARIARARADADSPSFAVPLPGLALIVNPASRPPESVSA